MKMFMFAAAAALATAAVAVPAVAQEGFNASVGYTHFDLSEADVGAITGRLGYRFHPNFGVEGEASFGVDDDEVAGFDVELDNAFGAYGVGYLPLSPAADLFGRIGYANVELDASSGVLSGSGDAEGLAFGAGIDFRFAGNLGVRAEYTRLEGDDDEEADMWGISGSARF